MLGEFSFEVFYAEYEDAEGNNCGGEQFSAAARKQLVECPHVQPKYTADYATVASVRQRN